jgi:hypothetical protein
MGREMSSRCNVLKFIGGGVVVAATATGGFLAMNQPSRTARAPWREAGGYDEFRRRALSYALLAPNPHNRQPWLVRLDGDRGLTLFCDLQRRLPATDPMDRQITIGCGAFLELLAIAAAQDGYAAVITLFPEGEDMNTLDRRPVAQVEFTAGQGRPDPLFAQILSRRSNKSVYHPRETPQPLLTSLAEAGSAFGTRAVCTGETLLTERLRDLTWRAHVREMHTPAALQESVDLMRIGAAEVTANPDGIELEGALIGAGRLAGVVNRSSLGDPDSTAFRQGLDMYGAMAQSAQAFGWLSNLDGARADQINAGRAYVRLNLKATELGLGIHPWSQSLQEYAEIADLYEEAHRLLGEGQRVQMLFRIGYADPVIPTPRRGLNAHLV